jgi:hypothetical protein
MLDRLAGSARWWVLALLICATAMPRAQAPTGVTGFVFDDTNRNGQREAGERGLAGVAVSNQRQVVLRTAATHCRTQATGSRSSAFLMAALQLEASGAKCRQGRTAPPISD